MLAIAVDHHGLAAGLDRGGGDVIQRARHRTGPGAHAPKRSAPVKTITALEPLADSRRIAEKVTVVSRTDG